MSERILEQEEVLLLAFPNILDERVPQGADEDANEIVRTWGEPRSFDFEPKEHHDLGEALGLYDAERATKVTGTRFAILKADLHKWNEH